VATASVYRGTNCGDGLRIGRIKGLVGATPRKSLLLGPICSQSPGMYGVLRMEYVTCRSVE
jgi:hypothetical protein